MTEPHLIGPIPGGAPDEAGMSGARSRSLPYDLLKDASKRLKIMSVLAAALWVLGMLGGRLALSAMGTPMWKWLPIDAIAAINVFASLGLFFYICMDDRDPTSILDVGLVYEIFTALGIGLIVHWFPMPSKFSISPTISWVGAIILMCAAITPNAPSKTLVAALIAVSMNPLGMLIARARGVWQFGAITDVLVMHYPDYILVGVAVVISHVVTKLGHQLNQAREMGSYRLVTLLGKGGMGEVWLARHQMLARDAAIKLVQPEVLSQTSGRNAALIRRRFEKEAKTTAALRSPHTVELYDFGVSKDGVFYYVMELLDGIDLETLVKEFGPQPPARVVRILRQVCRSLFLCRMGNEYDFAKVLDFGLVRVADENETRITVEGTTTGTPAFMAPEMALGESKLDGRTDLYGLGCVAYWLITGTLVFEEKNPTAMMLAHLQKFPVPPSSKIQGNVPPCLDQAIMMCLAKEPALRPASAEVFSRVLESCVDVGTWTEQDAESWWRENRAKNDDRPRPAMDKGPDALTTL
jgi:hypothetical protein